MPTSLAASRTQNERWELGRLQLARRFVPELGASRHPWRAGGAHRLRRRDARPAHAAALDPGGNDGRPHDRQHDARRGDEMAPGSDGRGARVAVGRQRSRTTSSVACASLELPGAVYRALLQAPRLVAWKVGLWLRMLVRPRTVEWRRTERNPSA